MHTFSSKPRAASADEKLRIFGMPSANVAALRRGYEALNSGDLSAVHALLHPEIE